MKRSTFCALASLAAVIGLASAPADAVTIPTVAIGQPGNASDTTGFGAVGYAFRIGMLEISNSQYVEFLNAKAASDPYDLYNEAVRSFFGPSFNGIVRNGSPGSYSYAVKPPAVPLSGLSGGIYPYDNKPANLMSWFSVLRFANWLHNGQGSGDTETGAYTLLGGTPTPSNANSITRNAGAKWFLPNENEWYKAAHYDSAAGVYFDYPTGSNVAPDNNLPTADSGNSANYWFNPARDSLYQHSDVGAYALSASPNGTFDQGGNVFEFLEAPGATPIGRVVVRGGDASLPVQFLRSTQKLDNEASFGSSGIGFRLAAAIPEPTSATATLVAAAMLLAATRSRRVA